MPWEDTNRGHIENLIDSQNWTAAYTALLAYIEKNGEDYWAKGFLALVKSHL